MPQPDPEAQLRAQARAEAKRLHKIADSDSTTGEQPLNATQSVADVCGHPLGLGGYSP